MKFRTLICATLAAVLVAVSSIHASAQSVEETTKTELVHVAELLIGFSYMTLGGGNVDGAVGDVSDAVYASRIVGDTTLEARAENRRKAYRAIGLVITAEAAEQKSETLASSEIKMIACRMADEVASDPLLTPMLKKMKDRYCAKLSRDTMSVAAEEQVTNVYEALLLNAAALYQKAPSSAIGNATAALDIAEAVGRKEILLPIRNLVFAYEAMSLMATGQAFEGEKVNMLAAGKIKALACQMSSEAAPELAPMLEKMRAACFI